MSIAKIIKADCDRVKEGQKIYNICRIKGKNYKVCIPNYSNGTMVNIFATEKVIKDYFDADLAYDENDNEIMDIDDENIVLTTIP